MDKSLLKGLADNPALMETVRQLLEEKFATDSLTSDHADEVLGQMVRARLVGLQAVKDAFKEIEQYRSTPATPPKPNPGR